MIYMLVFIAAAMVGLGALRVYIRFDERRLKRDAHRRGDRS